MRTMTLSLLALSLPLPAFAARSAVFCKVNGKIHHALSEAGRMECAGPLMGGNACFTGERAEIVAWINSGRFNWDEEWLERARLSGRDSIAYIFADGPNELREQKSMNRCDGRFFRR